MVNNRNYGPLTIKDGENIVLSGRYPLDFPIQNGADLKLLISSIDLIADNNLTELTVKEKRKITNTINFVRERRLHPIKQSQKEKRHYKKRVKPDEVRIEMVDK